MAFDGTSRDPHHFLRPMSPVNLAQLRVVHTQPRSPDLGVSRTVQATPPALTRMAEVLAQAFGQQVGTPRVVVDVADQRILNGNPTPRHIRVIPGRGQTSSIDQRLLTGTNVSRNSSSGVCSDTASVTCSRSSASLRIAGARPTVDTVTDRCAIPSPPGAGSQIRCTASTTRR